MRRETIVYLAFYRSLVWFGSWNISRRYGSLRYLLSVPSSLAWGLLLLWDDGRDDGDNDVLGSIYSTWEERRRERETSSIANVIADMNYVLSLLMKKQNSYDTNFISYCRYGLYVVVIEDWMLLLFSFSWTTPATRMDWIPLSLSLRQQWG